MRRLMDGPFHVLAERLFAVDAHDPEALGKRIRFRHHGEIRFLGRCHDDHDEQDGGAKKGVDHVRPRARGRSWRRRSRLPRRSAPRELPAGGSPGSVFRRPGPAASAPASATSRPAPLTKVDIEREKSAHDRHEQHAAAHAAEHRQDAEDERGDEQGQRPDPPGCGRLRHGRRARRSRMRITVSGCFHWRGRRSCRVIRCEHRPGCGQHGQNEQHHDREL